MAKSFDVKKIVRRKLSLYQKALGEQLAPRISKRWTEMLHADFDSGRTVYGEARPFGEANQFLKLVQSGRLRRGIGFKAQGHRVKAVYPRGKYVGVAIGRFKIMPTKRMPFRYLRAGLEVARDAIRELKGRRR